MQKTIIFWQEYYQNYESCRKVFFLFLFSVFVREKDTNNENVSFTDHAFQKYPTPTKTPRLGLNCEKAKSAKSPLFKFYVVPVFMFPGLLVLAVCIDTMVDKLIVIAFCL